MNYPVHSGKSGKIAHGDFRRGWMSRLVHRFRIWNENRIAIRELNALPDRLLDDIGIERAEIREAVKNQNRLVGIMSPRASQGETWRMPRAA